MSKPFDPEKYSDTYTRALKELIRKKAKGQKLPVIRGTKKSAKTESILALLKQSLEKEQRPRKRKSA